MKKSIKSIGAQLYTVRDFMKSPKDIETTFKKIKKIGYDVVQFSGNPIGDAKELRKIADNTGIKIICTHIPYTDFQNNLSKVIEDHHILGATHAGVGILPGNYHTKEGILEFTREFDSIAKELKKEGLGATYHNHRFEFERVYGKRTFDTIIENSTTFSFMLDTFWVHAGGADVAEFIRQHKDRLELVHLKDMQIVDNKQDVCEVMEGNMYWEPIMSEILDSDIEYAFVEQDSCHRDPFDCLETSYNNLKKYLEINHE